jgi:hypothetical protein
VALVKLRHATAAHSTPTVSSTSGYRQLIQAPQLRQRPRSTSQLTTGTFSHQLSVRPQPRQCDRGLTMLSPAGQRLRHTFRKLPKASPRSPAKMVPKTRAMEEIEYTVFSLYDARIAAIALSKLKRASEKGVELK